MLSEKKNKQRLKERYEAKTFLPSTQFGQIIFCCWLHGLKHYRQNNRSRSVLYL